MTLSALILIPLAGGLLSLASERFNAALPRLVGLVSMTLVLLLACLLWQNGIFDATAASALPDVPQWAFAEQYTWLPRLGASLHFALDGISLAMILLTGILGVLAMLTSWTDQPQRPGAYYLCLLWSLAGVLGVFLCIDLLAFFFFWEVMLIPVYFLIAVWGHPSHDEDARQRAALRMFLYTQAGGLLLLVGILGLALSHWQATQMLTFDYTALLSAHITLPPALQMGLMLCFFAGFAVKLPIVPLHGWLPDAHAHTPASGSVDLAGLLLKTAGYGMLRFTLPLFPEASREIADIAIGLGLFGVFYGAFLAFVQTDMKKLIAYTSISHMGFVLLALYAGTLISLQGLAVQMVAHGLCAAGLFVLAGLIQQRLGTRDLRELHGLWGRFTWLSPFLMIFAAALAGIPGTANFVGELLILLGAFDGSPWMTDAFATTMVLAGIYALWLVHRSLFGAPSDQAVADLSIRDSAILLSLVILLVFIGLYPQPLLDMSDRAMTFVHHAYTASAVQPLN